MTSSIPPLLFIMGLIVLFGLAHPVVLIQWLRATPGCSPIKQPWHPLEIMVSVGMSFGSSRFPRSFLSLYGNFKTMLYPLLHLSDIIICLYKEEAFFVITTMKIVNIFFSIVLSRKLFGLGLCHWSFALSPRLRILRTGYSFWWNTPMQGNLFCRNQSVSFSLSCTLYG